MVPEYLFRIHYLLYVIISITSYDLLFSPTHGGFRQWEGHEVKNNETMVGIALKYDITVEDIRRCNNLWTNDALWPGQVSSLTVN